MPTIAAADPRPSWGDAIADLEDKLTGRVLAVVGGVALVAGAIFFLSLAFSRDWIGHEGRVLIGIGSAGFALAVGAWELDHRQPTVGRVLVAVGLAVVSLSMFAATRLYNLVPVEIALLGSLVAAVAAAFLAVRNDAQIIAVLSLLAVLGAPPVLGASPTLVTVAYIGTVLVGFAALALFRTWRWLPSIAFALSAPQLASWLAGDIVPAVGIVAAVVFWTLNVVTAGGEEYLRPRNQLRLGSATLLLANAAFLLWAGFTLLDGPNEFLRGPFLIAIALAHAVLGGWFLLREGDHHPFGLLAAGTGVAALAMAAPVQAGGPPVPIAWAAEAAALAWLASRRAHPQAALAAAILGLMALAHLVGFEYPAGMASRVPTAGDWPFVNASGLTLVFLLGAATVAAWFLRARAVVAVIAGFGVLAVALAAPHELTGPALIAAWVGLALGALALERFIIDRLPEEGPVTVGLLGELRFATLAAAASVGAIALGHALVFDLPIDAFGTIRPPAIPFSDARALTLEFLVIGSAISGWVYLGRVTLELPAVAALVGAGLILAYGAVFEVYADAAIVIAAGLAVAGLLLGTLRGVAERAWRLATGASLALVGVGTLAALSVIAGLDRLVMAEGIFIDHPPFVSDVSAAYGALAVALAVAVRLNRRQGFAPWAGIAAGGMVVFALSVGVIDLFQPRTGGAIQFEELARQAQVVMSVLWIVLGAAVFVYGLARGHLVVRQAGLGLLALASLKVFVFDLASLDVAYRVLSLVALGTFLLLTAWVYARLRPPPTKPPRSSGPEAAAT
ncbi:MAG TPA: DUF2339 domain-containing protein [Candidatus Limnocylindrales bacterium]|nr:DUF2339 domain-containing protein [Candidatus Limnocylindrales bacterium]